MLLLIDAGNSRIKWSISAGPMLPAGAADAARWLYAGSVARQDVAQLASAWQGLAVQRVLVSNVAGAALRDQLQAMLLALFGTQTEVSWFASQAMAAGVRNSYRNPAQLGCDRFAALIGARALYPQRALIVATCGTATTIDALTADGEFIGGMILPGLAMMTTALALNTAQLPQIQSIDMPALPFADNTADAIVAGCIAAQAGAIERAVAAHAAQPGTLLCVLAGGASQVLVPHLAVPCEKVDNLVLIGLQVAADA